MTYPVDLLGRPPVLRPIVPKVAGDRPALRRDVRGDKIVVRVPYASTNSGAGLTAPVTLAAAPWEVRR